MPCLPSVASNRRRVPLAPAPRMIARRPRSRSRHGPRRAERRRACRARTRRVSIGWKSFGYRRLSAANFFRSQRLSGSSTNTPTRTIRSPGPGTPGIASTSPNTISASAAAHRPTRFMNWSTASVLSWIRRRLEPEGRVAHEDATAGLGQRTVQHQARDDVARSRPRAPAHLHPMLGIEADDDAGAPVDLAVDPDLTVVVDVRLEPHAGARQRDAPDRRGHLDGDPVPREGEAHRAALANIAAHLPARIVVIRQDRKSTRLNSSHLVIS